MTNTKTPKLSRNLIGKSGINWSKAPEGTIGIDEHCGFWVRDIMHWYSPSKKRWVEEFNYDWGTPRYIMKEDDLRETACTMGGTNNNSQKPIEWGTTPRYKINSHQIMKDDDLRTEDTQDMFYTEMTITYTNGKKFTVKGLRVDEDVVSVEFSKPKANLEVSEDERKDWTNDDWIRYTGDFKPGTTWGQKYDWLCIKLSYGNTDRVFPRGKMGYNQLIDWLISDNMRITGNQDVVGVLLETEKAKRKANKVKVDSKEPSEKPSTETTFSGIAVADKLKQGVPLSPEEIQSVLKILMEDNNYI